MAKLKIIRTGLTFGSKVWIEGEVINDSKNLPVSIDEQKTRYNGIVWYVEVGSPEEALIEQLGLSGLTQDPRATIRPGMAPGGIPPEEAKASIEVSDEAVVNDEEEEEEGSEVEHTTDLTDDNGAEFTVTAVSVNDKEVFLLASDMLTDTQVEKLIPLLINKGNIDFIWEILNE